MMTSMQSMMSGVGLTGVLVLRHSDHPSVVAIATDAPLQAKVPVLDMNDAEAVARFICSTLGLLCAREPRSGPLYPRLSAAC